MSLKTWMLSGMNRVFTRADLPARDAAPRAIDEPRVEPMLRGAGVRSGAGSVEHLGRYAPLIGAVREELEHFVASQLRLHLAIAERDRYLLTSIEVESNGSDAAGELLHRFIREFTPEQIRNFLTKEVIARLPNANAIDLGQFAGLTAGSRADDVEEPAYADLMHELQSGEPPKARAYQVTLLGRWCEANERIGRAGAGPSLDSPSTPLAGKEMMVDIEDADGRRRVELGVVTPGRRYVIGKDDGCDIVVNGLYASRRHCEVWFDGDTWWITDSGSTNGIRLEADAARGAAPDVRVSPAGDPRVLEVAAGATIVLSASARGIVSEYPRLALRTAQVGARDPANSRADSASTAPVTPVTPIVAPARTAGGWVLTARMASGVRTLEVVDAEQPIRVGRSRNQALVIEWAHQGVSGHHIDILERDATGAAVLVHGDNGVSIDGTTHATGTRFHWDLGQTMVLGRVIHEEPECALTLSRRT